MEAIYKIFSFIKIDKLSRRFIGPKRVAVLVYHNPKAAVFKAHAEYLALHYHFLSLPTLIHAMKTKDWSAIPPYGVVLTFDDGHADNFSLLPIFKKYKINPTIFVCTKIVGTNRKYWWMEVIKKKVEQLKKIPNTDRLKALATEYDFYQEKAFPKRQRAALSLEEIETMLPDVHFGNHTQYHPILPNLEEKEFEKELKAAKSDLAAIIPYPLDHVAFPNGDYTKRELAYLSNNDFQSGRTIEVGWNSMNTDPFALKILGITDNASIPKLKFQLSGLFGILIAWRDFFTK